MENLPSFETPELKAAIDKYYPFLIEVKKRVIVTVLLFVTVTVAGFLLSDKIIGLIVRIFGIEGVNVVFTSPFQFINLSISISLMFGLTILFPLILFQVVSFLRPALKKKEFRLIIYLVPFSIFLFIAGFGLGMFIMRYIVAASYLQAIKLRVGSFLDISDLISQTLKTSTLMGLAFQFPIVITALMRLNIIKHHHLAKSRFWAYAIAALFAGLLPPADVPSTVVYFIVLVFLFEVTLIINRIL